MPFHRVSGMVKPLYDLLLAHVLACDYVQLDENITGNMSQNDCLCVISMENNN